MAETIRLFCCKQVAMLYLTYADQPSGVFSSQVMDVCRYLSSLEGGKIKLVAFISLHNFKNNKRKIKRELPDAWVIPMLPRMTWFGCNTFLLGCVVLLSGQRSILARNVLACNMALKLKNFFSLKVCFDGRGAIAAEWNEYEVVPVKEWKKAIHEWEKNVVLKADFRIAVSSELVNYWKQSYGYTDQKHVVIPCTLNSDFKAPLLDESAIASARHEMGFAATDVVLVYAGSTAGWQSFDLLKSFLIKIMLDNSTVKVLFLSEKDKNVDALKQEFTGRIFQKFVSHSEVTNVLKACDYGILIREHSITNKVAAPTKFAEYLSAGLPVLISPEIGDYTAFVEAHHCGFVIDSTSTVNLIKNPIQERQRYINLVLANYTKSSQTDNYFKLIKNMM
jgi:hypothetical protein